MIDPQDEYNARRAKLMWLLSAKRVFADSDALDQDYNTFSDLAREVNRPDSVVILNPGRKPNSTVRVDTDHSLAAQQFDVMRDAQQLLQQTAGVYQSMMGGSQSGVTSGLAINSLVEQGATTLAEINDNYRYARRLVGEELMRLIVEDIGNERREIAVGDGGKAKVIVLNDVQPDGRILNDVQRAGTKVALADVPSTPAYRAQQLSMLGELTKSLPPNIQATIIDFVIEATDLPNRREMADRVRKALGIQDPGDMTPEQQTEAERMLRDQEALQQQSAELELRNKAADAADKEAGAAKKMAEARKIEVELSAVSENERQLRESMGALMAQVADISRKAAEEVAQVQRNAEAQLAEMQDALAEAQLREDVRGRELQAQQNLGDQLRPLIEQIAALQAKLRADVPA
jgi:hypothetical protein